MVDGAGAVATISPEIMPFKTESSSIESKASGLAATITDDETLQRAADEVTRIAGVRKTIAAKFEKIKTPQYQAWKATVALEKEVDTPYANAETKLRAAALDFNRERQRIAEEARIKAEDETRRKADEERLKLASAHAETGDQKKADEILDDPFYVPPAPVPTTAPAKIKGMSFTKTWRAEVFDLKALCRAVADGTVEETAVSPNWEVLNGIAKALKKEFKKYPGVRAIEVESTARR